MNQPSLKALAFRISVFTALLAGLIFFFSAFNFSFSETLLIACITVIVVGIFIYFLFLYYVRNYITAPIRSLYKAIYNVKVEDGEKSDISLGSEPMQQIQQEVSAWMKNRSTEIEDLKKLEDYRREFLGNVSHELKTPIFNIQGYITTLLDGGLEDPSINRNYLERAEKSVERMINIVEDLESISRLEVGQLLVEPTPFDIYALVMEVYYAQEMNAKSRNIKLSFREPYRAVYVNADKDHIRQVITNLITNSIKYGKPGGETETRFYDIDENVLVEISDNGIGIAKEHLQRLFERFYRVDKGRSREQGGTGLG
ncbi:MAG: sensor histidine kinase, partial [Chitinophagales bacterium]